MSIIDKTNIVWNQPLVAIVVLNWNGEKFLKQFLPSVIASTYENKKIIVADNASTDCSVSFLQENYPSIEVIKNPINEGFAKGYNMALQHVDADYYVLLNSDVEVTTNWIEPIISLMESDDKIGACQPKIRSYNNRNAFEYAGASGGWIDRFGYPFSRGRIFDECEEDKGQYDDAAPCFWATGAALFVKAKLFHMLDGFDDYFFAHQEEIDLCWRMQNRGYKVYVEPKSVVYHVGGGTLPKGNSKKTYLNFRNNLIMMAKNLPIAESIWKIPFRFVLDAITAWRSLMKGDSGYWTAVAKAHFHFMQWLILKQHKPKQTKHENVRQQYSGLYNGSVVWAYFIKKQKTFLEIVGRK